MRFFAKFVTLALIPAAVAFAGESKTAVMDLQKIQCFGCLQTVNKALQTVPGVEDTKLDLDHKTATVRFDPAKTNTDALSAATAKAGFPSSVRK